MDLDKLTALWTRVRDSLWFLPTVLTLAAAGLAFITVQLDLNGILAPHGGSEAASSSQAMRIAFAGTANGARSVLNAIATGLITVTGVVFSVTIVAIQLASTQFTPRILRNFTADRGNQLVLGVFIGTFTYALLVQRVVRGESGEAGSFVPNLSVTVAMGLALISIGFLIFFIDHAARSVQAAVIVDRVTAETLRTIRRTLPDEVASPVDDDVAAHLPEGPGSPIRSEASGYVQGVDRKGLLEVIGREGRTIRLEPHMGDFVLKGGLLATVWPADDGDDGADGEDLGDRIRDALILGYERTPRLDPELGVIELVDIAVKALSPGINDPTTATICLDQLSRIVVEFGRRKPPQTVHRHPENGGILILPRPEFAHLVETAFNEIRHFGADNPHFAGSMLRRLAEIGRLIPPERRAPLALQAEALLREALSHDPPAIDAASLEHTAKQALDVLRPGAPLRLG